MSGPNRTYKSKSLHRFLLLLLSDRLQQPFCLPNAGVSGVNHRAQLDRDICVCERFFVFYFETGSHISLHSLQLSGDQARLELTELCPPSAGIKDMHHTPAMIFLRQGLILAQSSIDIFGNSMHNNSWGNILLTSRC